MNILRTLGGNFVVRRVVEALLTLIGVSIFTFVLLRVVPGNQITAAYGTAAGELSASQIHALEAYYGINQPIVTQYLSWLGGVLTGNLGYNTTAHETVLSMTASALPNTIELSILSIIVGLLLGIPGGVFAASRVGRLRDDVTQIGSLLGLSIPSFLLATAAGSWLANSFGWYPNGEGYATFFEDPGLNLEQMLLPAVVLGIGIAPPVLQTTRAAIIAVQREDYIRTARAKGVHGVRLRVRHVLRNALIPTITMSGLQFGFLLGGAIVIEQIFAIPGIGQQTILGLNQKEYATVQSTVLIIATMFVLVNLGTDLLYRIVDPRVKLQ